MTGSNKISETIVDTELKVPESERSTVPGSSRRLLLVAQIAIGCILLFAVFRQGANVRETLWTLRHAKFGLAILGLMAAVIGELMTAWKWQVLLAQIGYRIGLGRLFHASLIGMFYNCLLPTSVGGDIAKMILVARDAGGKAVTTASIFMQRNTGFAALLVIANVALWIAPINLQRFSGTLTPLNHISFWFALIAVAFILTNLFLFSRLPLLLIRISTPTNQSANEDSGTVSPALRLFRKVGDVSTRLHEALLLFRPGITIAILISLVTQLNDCAMIYVAAHALGIHLTFLNCCVFLPSVTLVALLPITFFGIGLREQVYRILLASAGISASVAVGLSLMHFSYLLLMAVVGGIMQFLHVRRRQ